MNEFEDTIRDNGSKVTTQPYSKQNVSWLKRLIHDSYRNGNPKMFDIRINGEIVVSKNSDGRRFDDYLRYFNETTTAVEIRLYQGSSPNCNKYIYMTEQAASLSGTPTVSAQIQKALEQDRQKRELAELRAENERLKRKIKKLKIAAQKGQPMQQLRGLLSDVGAAYQTIKGANPLAGVDQTRVADQNEQAQEDTEVEIEVEVESEESEADQVYHMVKDKLGEQNTITCYRMINELGQHPELFKKMQQELKRKNQSVENST